jgi:selenium metabolism protein YedF
VKIIVDAKKRPCPEPIILTKKAIDEGANEITVIVDNPAARENVERFAKSRGFSVEAEGDGIFTLTLNRIVKTEVSESACAFDPTTREVAPEGPFICYVNSEFMGEGSEELGAILMRAFIKTLGALEKKPEKIVFANSGVKITTRGSKLLDDLGKLEDLGTEILSCGTCLDYYKLTSDLMIGKITNMLEMVTLMSSASRVLRP